MTDAILLLSALLGLVVCSTLYRARQSALVGKGVQRITCHGALQLGDRTAAFSIECDGRRFMVVRSASDCVIVPTSQEPV